MKSSFLLIVSFFIFAGCASKRYSEFTGSQNWVVAAQAMADNSYAVPVYRTWPDRPYRVIGSIAFANIQNDWKDGDTAHAARIAKRHGGQAIVMRYGGEFGVGAVAGAAADAQTVSMSGGVTALVIKWRPQSEIETERKNLEQFYNDYKNKNPDRDLSLEFVSMGAEYVEGLGVERGTPSWSEKLSKVIDDAFGDQNRGKPYKWFFKGTVQSEGITTSFTELFFGVAKVTESGANITILSDTGDVPVTGLARGEINFSGAEESVGKISGQIGFSYGRTIFSGKAEGVVARDKIVLNAQGQTAAGIVQGSFVFVK